MEIYQSETFTEATTFSDLDIKGQGVLIFQSGSGTLFLGRLDCQGQKSNWCTCLEKGPDYGKSFKLSDDLIISRTFPNASLHLGSSH